MSVNLFKASTRILPCLRLGEAPITFKSVSYLSYQENHWYQRLKKYPNKLIKVLLILIEVMDVWYL